MNENKAIIRKFMQEHYSDERLAQLLAHARDGKLAYHSCCCFIGVVTANHPLREHSWGAVSNEHYTLAVLSFRGARAAEEAFLRLGMSKRIVEMRRSMHGEELAHLNYVLDNVRRRILIPMIRAEMKRREKARAEVRQAAELVAEFA